MSQDTSDTASSMASAGISIGGALSVVKLVDESRTNDNVYAVDDELFFDVEADSTYLITVSILMDGQDMDYKITYPEEVGVRGVQDSVVGGGSNLDEDGAQDISTVSWADLNTIVLRTAPAPGGAGQFAIQWRQSVSSGLPTTMLAGSAITYQKLENA